MFSVFFETFGCQMNVADSDMLSGLLAERGYTTTIEFDDADLIVVNTCSVREHAESRAKTRLREFAHAMHKNQELWVIGCMAERLGEELKKEIPKISRVIGSKALEFLADTIDSFLVNKMETVSITGGSSPVSVFLPVMRGCDNYCAYCIVPYVRGHEHSIPVAAILDQAGRVVDKGTKEITLLGQNVNSYSDDGRDFSDIMTLLHEIEGLERIRFMTSHPKDLSGKLIKTIAGLPKVCNHIHLPVQSGSSGVLAAMNRQYTREQYLQTIEKIKMQVPVIDLTTDALIGFPGETDRDFEDTLTLFKEVEFTNAFMFAFSGRTGTAAASFPDQVPEKIRMERLNTLITMQTEITKKHFHAMVGKEIQVLFTRRQQRKDKAWTGQDYGCKRVLLHTDEDCAGKLLTLTVAGTTGMTLIAKG
jgi:tRNA-2-methylthio-N6-dimethylallyladenosine synthase